MAKNFSATERMILKTFYPRQTFNYDNKKYTVLVSAKPQTQGGECKTDVYVSATCGTDLLELKISVKQNNADFLDNFIININTFIFTITPSSTFYFFTCFTFIVIKMLNV